MVTACVEATGESWTASPVNSAEAADPPSTESAAHRPDVTPTNTSAVTSAKTSNVASADPPSTERAAQTSDAPPAETSNMTSTEAADPASANPAAHSPDVTPTQTPAMASSALGLRRGYRDASDKCRGRQNHHQPFQHRMFLLACLMSRRTGASEVAALAGM
jgi:hypothetical protein